MSAIAGVNYFDGRSVERSDLGCMLERATHRGPDGAGVWNERAAGLAHRMLWTTPESLREKLPLANKTEDLILTADVRIDNRDELIAALDFNGRPKNEITDSELILASYEKWGDHCPEKLLGDFAFAIWDRRRQVLFCARDHFGVKPFYYHYRSGRIFVFASEIKVLLCLPEVPRRLNEVRVADYLDSVLLLADKSITFYQDILRLPPGHCLIVGDEGIRLQPYWALDPSRELRLGSDEEYAEAFRELFTEAVRCRLRSAYPIGAMLSGGLDSSSIVCVARQLLAQNGNGRVQTFSAIFDDLPQCDERPFIDAVLAQGELEPHFVQADRADPLAELDRVFWHQDEAFYGPNLYMHWALYRAAHEQGVRILFDGFDGDTTVSHGIAYLPELARAWRWSALAAEVLGLSRNFNVSAWRILWHHALQPLIPEPARDAWRLLRGRNQPQWDPIINPQFAQRINLAERVAALKSELVKPRRSSREDHWSRLTNALTSYALEVADKAAAAFLISPQFPFFDKRLAEFCLALPAEQKIRQGWTRMVMRHAMANLLPGKVQWRGSKSNLSPMLTRGLLAHARGIVEEVILNNPKTIEAYVDTDVLRKAYDRYASRGASGDALTVWKGVTLALWLRQTGLTQ